MKIALGAVQYYWSRTAMMQFYEAMTEAPVDIVYLGEVVCSRRHELRLPDWLEIADMLAAAGKEVVLSTQILLESGKDMTTLKAIVDNGRYRVEANDMGAVHLAENTPFVAGAWLNVYNPSTLNVLAGMGAQRWVMPLEMSRDNLSVMQSERPSSMQTEVFAYGRMPLAFSAIPAAGKQGPVGATLGGTGIAVSAYSGLAEAALAFAYWVASGDVQRGPYADAGGQPANAAAWNDAAVDAANGGFYRSTRETLEQALVRPRHDGWLRFQQAGAERINTGLAGRVLRVRGPRNRFELIDAPAYVFIAGGIGITPIVPMVRAAAAKRYQRRPM